jgi:hypothetical protein
MFSSSCSPVHVLQFMFSSSWPQMQQSGLAKSEYSHFIDQDRMDLWNHQMTSITPFYGRFWCIVWSFDPTNVLLAQKHVSELRLVWQIILWIFWLVRACAGA